MKNELAAIMDTRSSSAIPFIEEHPLKEILGSRLPTKGEVFRHYYFLRYSTGLLPANAQKNAVQSAQKFWSQAGILTKKEDYAISDLVKIITEFQVLPLNQSNV